MQEFMFFLFYKIMQDLHGQSCELELSITELWIAKYQILWTSVTVWIGGPHTVNVADMNASAGSENVWFNSAPGT